MTSPKIELSSSATGPNYKVGWWTSKLAGPIIVAAAIRFTLLAITLARNGTSTLIQGDSLSYLSPGRNLILHGSFVADGAPDLLRTPGYPLFLAVTTLAGPPFAAVVNVILSVFSVLLVWRLGRAAFDDPRVALGAAWLLALEPGSVTWSVVLLSDTLFVVLYLLSLERFAHFLRFNRLPVLVMAGLLLAAAIFVRPVAYYLPLALALWLLLAASRAPDDSPQPQKSIARKLLLRSKAPAVLLITVVPWLAAWQIRNWIEADYSGFSSVAEINLYYNDAANLTAEAEHRNYSEVRDELGRLCWVDCNQQTYLYQPYLTRNPKQAGWSQGQRLAFMHTQAVSVIRAHLWLYSRSCLTSLAWVMFDPGTRAFDALIDPGKTAHFIDVLKDKGFLNGTIEFVRTNPRPAIEKVAFESLLLCMYLLAARGIFHFGGHDLRPWLLLGTTLYFLGIVGATTGGPGVDARYRLPVMPILCILAAAEFWRTKVSRAKSITPPPDADLDRLTIESD